MGPSVSKRPVVLIVEDEFLLRLNAVEMINAAGFEVVEAGDADHAIEILEARRDIGLRCIGISLDVPRNGCLESGEAECKRVVAGPSHTAREGASRDHDRSREPAERQSRRHRQRHQRLGLADGVRTRAGQI